MDEQEVTLETSAILDLSKLDVDQLQEIRNFLCKISVLTTGSLTEAAFSSEVKHRYMRGQIMLVMAEIEKRSNREEQE